MHVLICYNTVIIGAWLLGFHANKFASVHNYLGWRVWQIMNVGEDLVAKRSAEIRDNLLLWCNWRQRSEMICCHSCLVRSWSLQSERSSRMTQRIGAARMKASSRRRATSEMTRSDRGSWLLGHISSFCEDQILTTTLANEHCVATG